MNILLITTDQLRYDALGANGNKAIRTPHLDGLAGEGVRCSRAYTPCALCSPARASLLTGRFPHRHGVLTNTGQDQTRPEMPEHEVTFAQLLTRGGYRTGYVGKWHVGVAKGPKDWGFTDMEPQPRRDFRAQFGETIRFDDVQSSRVHDNRFVLAARRDGSMANDDTGYCESQGTALLEEYARGDKPFFLRIDFSAPHPPYVVPEPYASMYSPSDIDLEASITDEGFVGKPYIHEEQTRRWGTGDLTEDTWRRIIARYYGLVTLVDDAVGRLLERLHGLGLEDNTLVIFTADHGDATGSHRMYDKGYCGYEEQFHIPLILRGRGLAGGRVCEEWITSLDLMPTIVEAAGQELPPDLAIDGQSLLPAIREGASLGRDSIFAEFHGMQYGLCSLRLVRDERHKYVLNANDRPELYDLAADPCELRNLAGTEDAAEDERRMYAKLLRWMERTADPMLKTIWGRAAYDPHYRPPAGNPWFLHQP